MITPKSVLPALGFALALLTAWAAPASAQDTGRVTGQVIDQATRQPLVGVQVHVNGTSLNAVTGENGRFLILNVPAGAHTIVASLIGYAEGRSTNVSVEAGQTATVNFELQTEAVRLSELVVTGVVDPVEGVKMPFVVSRLAGENITAVPTTQSALAAMQGKVAGVSITRPSGQPGGGVYIEMRTPTTILGSDSPLYVVDGVILGTGTQDIESLDIESIEIIKGAAGASLYGSRAAAGVVQITTRRGRDLNVGATRIRARTEYGFSQLPNRRPSLSSRHAYLTHDGDPYTDANGETVNPGDYIDNEGNKADRAARVIPTFAIMDKEYREPLYDNLGALFQPGRFLTNNVSISQNFQNTNYTVSLNSYDEAGALTDNSGFQRYNGRVNLDHRFTENFNVSVSGYHSRSTRDDLSGSPFSTLLYYDPTIDLGAKDADGNYIQFPDPSYDTENPVWRNSTRENWTKRERTLASMNFRYTPARWLTVQGTWSYDRANIQEQIYVPKGVPQAPFEADPSDGRLYYYQNGIDAQNGSLLVSANRTFGRFNPRVTVGGSFERSENLSFYADGRNFAVKGLRDIDMAIDKSRMGSVNNRELANGLLTDFGLDYADKYIGSLVVRRDGSSRFGERNRWHTYYAVRGAYRMAEEPWWPIKHIVSEFKPRFAIGTSGGRPTFAQQHEAWSVSIPTGGTPSFSRGNGGNPLLAPEETMEREIGLDFTLFQNHDFRFTYVTQETDGLILQGVGPAAEGYFSRWENIGGQSGKTYEFEYEARLINGPEFSWNAAVVADRSDSWISRWDRPSYPSGYRQMGLEGTLYDMWGRYVLTSRNELLSKGRVPEEFHSQFDVNDDGYVVWVGEGNTWRDGHEKNLWGTTGNVDGVTYYWGMPIPERTEAGDIASVKIGSSQPDFNWGLMNNIRYKQFNVHIHFRGQVGGNIYADSRQQLYRNYRHGDLDQSGKADHAKKPVAYYRESYGLYQNNSYASPFVEDATFLKLQALSISYRLQRDQLSRLLGSNAPESLTLGLNGRNIFTLTNYSGWDPDVGSPTGRVDSVNLYPNMRQWTAMVEIAF